MLLTCFIGEQFMYAKRAQEIIDFHNPGDPLFLYLPFQSVHGPLEVPQEYANLYKDVPDPQRRTYLGENQSEIGTPFRRLRN